jgi:hypothetical protein
MSSKIRIYSPIEDKANGKTALLTSISLQIRGLYRDTSISVIRSSTKIVVSISILIYQYIHNTSAYQRFEYYMF